MEIKRAYKFRFYPTDEQKEKLAQTFGCARFAYNYMLKARADAYYNEQKRIGYHETSALLTQLKKQDEYSWLNNVSSVPVQQALRHLQTAFGNFFAKRNKYPNFKSKFDKQSAEYTASAFKFENGVLTLAKMKEPLPIKWSRTLPKAAKLTTVTVSKDCAGRYFVSLLCDDAVPAQAVSESKIGVDLGLTDFAVTSTGSKYQSPKSLRNNLDKLALLQKRLSKKKKGSSNRNKARLKVAKLHAKITDARKDFLHKLSTKLINENQVIAVESLAVSNMLKNRKLAKSISDAGWSEFLRQLEYKAKWYGRTLIGIDKWYPSSKRCNACGYMLSTLSLNTRTWVCPDCKTTHDRDVNAAKNILTAGLAGLAFGENVSPVCI
ncbi:MAG TPA: IS200/IS605 family element RNA-guided endonuclease TnpB [Cellvibrio sp.]|jgi:putative transposase|nr:IS200/IS605 family element RNA-guided endonuclease TnpB [Cellvibrio sp.]